MLGAVIPLEPMPRAEMRSAIAHLFWVSADLRPSAEEGSWDGFWSTSAPNAVDDKGRGRDPVEDSLRAQPESRRGR